MNAGVPDHRRRCPGAGRVAAYSAGTSPRHRATSWSSRSSSRSGYPVSTPTTWSGYTGATSSRRCSVGPGSRKTRPNTTWDGAGAVGFGGPLRIWWRGGRPGLRAAWARTRRAVASAESASSSGRTLVLVHSHTAPLTAPGLVQRTARWWAACSARSETVYLGSSRQKPPHSGWARGRPSRSRWRLWAAGGRRVWRAGRPTAVARSINTLPGCGRPVRSRCPVHLTAGGRWIRRSPRSVKYLPPVKIRGL
jgi:hypothetical protein